MRLIFLLFAVLAFGCDENEYEGGDPADLTVADAESALLTLGIFFATMSLGVWYVFRKRGRIYI